MDKRRLSTDKICQEVWEKEIFINGIFIWHMHDLLTIDLSVTQLARHSPFKVVYSYNPISPLDLASLPTPHFF